MDCVGVEGGWIGCSVEVYTTPLLTFPPLPRSIILALARLVMCCVR